MKKIPDCKCKNKKGVPVMDKSTFYCVKCKGFYVVDIVRLMAHKFYEDYEKTVDKEWLSIMGKKCKHKYMIDEKHAQIVSERKLGTKRVNLCIKCGKVKTN